MDIIIRFVVGWISDDGFLCDFKGQDFGISKKLDRERIEIFFRPNEIDIFCLLVLLTTNPQIPQFTVCLQIRTIQTLRFHTALNVNNFRGFLLQFRNQFYRYGKPPAQSIYSLSISSLKFIVILGEQILSKQLIIQTCHYPRCAELWCGRRIL